jgi:hypothetical protein
MGGKAEVKTQLDAGERGSYVYMQAMCRQWKLRDESCDPLALHSGGERQNRTTTPAVYLHYVVQLTGAPSALGLAYDSVQYLQQQHTYTYTHVMQQQRDDKQ